MDPIPKYPNEETRLAAARVTAKLLIDEAGVDGDLEDIAKDIAKYCRHGDGYEMAKDLERAHWDCDMRIAEVLDGHSHSVDRAHQQFLACYQKEHDIQPQYGPGTLVKTRHGLGTIDRVYEYRPMTYAVKMDGDEKADSSEKRRTLLMFDEVEAA